MIKIKLTLLLLVSALILSSCGIIIINRSESSTEAATTEPPSSSYEPPEYPVVDEVDYEELAKAAVNALPSYDFDGLSVIIAAVSETGDIFNDTEGIYSDTVTRRNSIIADKYDTKIITDYKSSAAIQSDIKAAEKAGDYYADFVAARAYDIGTYSANKYIQNLKSLSYTDFERDYFNHQAMDQLSFGGVIYGAVGSMTETPETYACLFFNKTLGKEIGVQLDYVSIYDFTFTWDKLLTQLGSVDGDCVSFTSSYGNDYISRYAFSSTGQTYLSRDDQTFVQNFVNDTSSLVVKHIKKLISYRIDKYTYNKTVVDAEGNEVSEKVTVSGFDIFKEGKALVATGLLSNMSEITNCGFDWEVLPMPKLSEEGRYISAVSDNAPVLVTLDTSPNIDTNGYILQALGASSYGYLKSTFIKAAMRDHVTGIHSPDMLDLILESPMYDHAYMFGSKFSGLKNGTYAAFYNAVKGKSSLSYYVNKYKTSLNNYLKSLK